MAKKKNKARAQKPKAEKPNKQNISAPNTSSSEKVTYRLKPGVVRTAGTVVVVVLLLLLMAFIFSNRNAQVNPDTNASVDSGTDENGEVKSESTENENSETTAQENIDDNGLNGDGVSTSKVTSATSTAAEKAVANKNQIKATGRWIATNYEFGDIKSGNYLVEYGDTLWEISEAVYGSGFDWKIILEANKELIGFLPNGSQALIFPGQILLLPEKK